MSIALENLRRDARMRIDTDREMSMAWMIVPCIPIIVFGIFFAGLFGSILSGFNFNATSKGTTTPSAAFPVLFFASFFILYVGTFVAQILFSIMVYKLVKRRNTHFARQQLLYEDLLTAAREVSGRRGIDSALQLNNLDRSIREARTEETEKSAGLYAVVTFIFGIIALYVFYFLMKDFFRHERREDLFFDDLNKTLSASGVAIRYPPRTLPVPDRSFAIYLILTIVTAGIFGIYWIYVLLTDPNNHFRQQAMVEDTVLAQVTPVLGGQVPGMMPPTTPPPPPTSYTSSGTTAPTSPSPPGSPGPTFTP